MVSEYRNTFCKCLGNSDYSFIQLLNLPVRILLLLILFLISGLGVRAQIVDDTTKQVYGPKTTKFIDEQIILNNGEYQPLDTSIYLFERQSLVDKSERTLQDLGVIGTALFPILQDPAPKIGKTSGYTSYNRYAFDASKIKYYDTKSPFFDLFAMLGGGNRNILRIGFSRNINPNWNFGFNYNVITVDKQLARNGEGDRQVESSAFVGYTHYKHPKRPYQVLFNYSQLNHNTVELGGVRYLTNDEVRAELFQFDNALLRLDEAQTNVKLRRLHVYQDYRFADQFQLYNITDNYSEENTFKDFAGGTSGTYDPYRDFYSNFFIDEDSTYQRANFNAFSNETGIKGNISSIYYRAFVKSRWVDFKYNYLDPDERAFEQYIGGVTRFKWRDKFSVTANGSYILGGGYELKGMLSSKLISAYYRTANYTVPYLNNTYFGNHHEWANNFNPLFTNELGGNIFVNLKLIELIPEIKLTSYQNYLYFDQQRQARQNNGTFVISRIGGRMNFRFLNDKNEGWHFENQIYYSTVAGDGSGLARVPDLIYNGRLFWRGEWFDDLVPFEVGLDTHARSAFFANSYAPETQQFYLQDDYKLESFFKADFFLSMRLDKFFLSVKWTHLDDPNDGGYFASPYYPGQPRALDLNVRWLFFD